ncbi:MAG: ribulokinase, partial [Bacteroidales bacterium]|nr:ribulokinase [Bacteroidales bacterium]
MSLYTIGIDYGTDSARAVLVDASDGRILASSTSPYRRWAAGRWCDAMSQQFRQHPSDYIECLESVLREVVAACPDPAGIKAIAVDTTGSTVCFTDACGMPLSLQPAFAEEPDAMFILWKDHTGTAEAEEFTAAGARYTPNYICQSGNHYSAECTWAKVLHVLRTNPEVRGAAGGFIDECDFITNLLTGCRSFADMKWGHCIPAAKQLWNKDWGGYPPESFFEEIDPLMIPMLRAVPHTNYACSEAAGTLCPEWAEKLGLSTSVVVGVGNCDAHSGAVGAGVRPGAAVLNLGTSACYMAVMPLEEMKGHFIDGLFGQAEGTILEGYMGYETGLSAFGDIFAWFKRLTGRELPALAEEASKLELRDDLPLATDFFNGRRAPNPSNIVTASISGLRITSGPAEIYRALVEAAAFGSKACIDQYIDGGIRIDKMIAVGG